jgi:serine/threonine-protein kinase RsbW
MDSSLPRPLAVEVNAEPERLGDLRDQLAEWLAAAGAPVELRERLVLAMNEAVTNSVAHAYRNNPAGPVRVSAQRSGNTVQVVVSDHGHWRPARPNNGPGGRGVLIMQESVDEVLIDRTPEGTTVTLRAEMREHPEAPDNVEPADGQHTVDIGVVGDTTVARLHGTVPGTSGVLLRRQLLGATCGGVVPLVVDLGGLEAVTSAVVSALSAVAHAVAGTGERMVVVAPSQVALAQLRPLTGLGESVRVVHSG